ncbi:hypothetical protein ES695_05905 [Candidatus Atribacteria bacterium 1244-E10-H5-B2]|nr:MAG: hypothetical protein ES695_05905 [Candidatus Atribacteria bacterium 1244-E10-H5-B2]
MSLYDYQKSKEIAAKEPSFATLIMAAAWKADTLNFGRLRLAFPEIIKDLEKRYFRGGVLSRGH